MLQVWNKDADSGLTGHIADVIDDGGGAANDKYMYILCRHFGAGDAGDFRHDLGACVSEGRLGGFWSVGLTASAVKPERQKSRAGKAVGRGRWRTGGR